MQVFYKPQCGALWENLNWRIGTGAEAEVVCSTLDLGLGKHTLRHVCRAHKFSNLDEMDQFLKSHKIPKLTECEIDNLNGSTTIKEAEYTV